MLFEAGAVLGIAGSGLNWYQNEKAIDAQLAADMETERRAQLQRDWIVSEGKATEAASGVVAGQGSMANYLANMASEFRRQHDWNVRVAHTKARLGHEANMINLFTGTTAAMYRYAESSKLWEGMTANKSDASGGGRNQFGEGPFTEYDYTNPFAPQQSKSLFGS